MKLKEVFLGLLAVLCLLSVALYYWLPYAAKNAALENKGYYSVVSIERGYDKNGIGREVRLGLQKARFEWVVTLNKDGTKTKSQSYRYDRYSKVDLYVTADKESPGWKHVLELAETVDISDCVAVHVRVLYSWIHRINEQNYYSVVEFPNLP